MYSADCDEADEVCEELVVSCCDAPEVLEFVEYPLDCIAFLVQVPVAGMRSSSIVAGRDDGPSTSFEDGVMEVFGVIGAVGDDEAGRKALDQLRAEQNFAAMAGAGDKAQRHAKRIAHAVQLGAQPALGSAKTLGFSAPFLRRAPAAC